MDIEKGLLHERNKARDLLANELPVALALSKKIGLTGLPFDEFFKDFNRQLRIFNIVECPSGILKALMKSLNYFPQRAWQPILGLVRIVWLPIEEIDNVDKPND